MDHTFFPITPSLPRVPIILGLSGSLNSTQPPGQSLVQPTEPVST